MAQAPSSQDLATLDEVNRIRRRYRLKPLRFNQQLWIAARDHSREQHKHGYMGHGSPDPRRNDLGARIRMAGFDGLAWAEVVAYGYTDVRGVVQGWMDSRPHRKILVDPDLKDAGFHRVGKYWTGNFGTPRRNLTVLREAPSAPRATTPRRTTTPRSSVPRSVPRSTTRPRTTVPAPRTIPTPRPRRTRTAPAPAPAPIPAPKPPPPSTGSG